MRAKETFRFVAGGPLAHGIDVAMIAYTLAPEAALREIVDEVQKALTWLAGNAQRFGGDPRKIYVSGWSAGAHLAAMSLGHPAMRGGLAISGIYDLEPIRLTYVNEKLKLDADDAAALSPQRNLISSASPLFVAYGTAELGELKRQSEEYAAARASAGLAGQLYPAPGHNHFTILEELASPTGALTSLVRELTAQ
jgi:acetyl esterase/lipase